MITPAARQVLEALLGPRIAFDAPLARHTSLGVGGPADALAAPQSRDELAALVALAAEQSLPLRVLGGGFNTLVLDGGIDGIVVRTHRLRALTLDVDAGALHAEAGVSHSQVVRLCAAQGLSGLEFGAGVPGTVGGWIAMNAGVPGAEIGDVVREVEVAGPGAGRSVRSRAEMDFGYRAARGLAPGAVVLAARFALRSAERPQVRTEIDRHLAQRRATQPVDQPSFGSVFKNPSGAHAGALIDRAGLKGLQIGGAQISPRHANFIVNRGGATAADVLALIARAQTAVSDATGITLEPEVHIVGRPASAPSTSSQLAHREASPSEPQRADRPEQPRASRCR